MVHIQNLPGDRPEAPDIADGQGAGLIIIRQPWPAELRIADGGRDMAKRVEDRLLRQNRALASSIR